MSVGPDDCGTGGSLFRERRVGEIVVDGVVMGERPEDDGDGGGIPDLGGYVDEVDLDPRLRDLDVDAIADEDALIPYLPDLDAEFSAAFSFRSGERRCRPPYCVVADLPTLLRRIPSSCTTEIPGSDFAEERGARQASVRGPDGCGGPRPACRCDPAWVGGVLALDQRPAQGWVGEPSICSP